ncbi:AEC family transporter [Psychrobacillus sp. AK 1817]|uniref:AEC family transporter n=1 Tax=Psychrobacillus sp. AK 1817 TaxID=2303505 RepID=UPI0012466DB0|nr:AEC family transporter [Psychrobacillus sp. AK 1817]QEY20979.1 AEC family transporter [Psychrobacillus sp. AK 1817]
MNLLLIILPVFIIFFIGFIGQRLIGFDIKSISSAALYLMSPFLAFRTFYTHELSIDYVYILIACLGLTFSLLLIAWLSSLFMQTTRSELSALILGSVFPNSGNYGAPVVLFALGAVGFDYAVVIMVFHGLIINTIGIFFASLGGEEKATWKQAIYKVLRMPLAYASALGILLQLVDITVPLEGVGLAADASIPTVMLVLGMQLAVISKKKVAYHFVSTATIIRMAVSPLVAAVIVSFMPLDDLYKTVFIIQSAMPTAANTTLLALQFGTEPDLVSFMTFITTILSIITIPLTLFFLGI